MSYGFYGNFLSIYVMKTVYLVVIVALIAIVAIVGLNMQREETPGERIGNAVDEMGDGMEDAAEEMQNRSPMEKVGDSIEDAGEEVNESMQ